MCILLVINSMLNLIRRIRWPTAVWTEIKLCDSSSVVERCPSLSKSRFEGLEIKTAFLARFDVSTVLLMMIILVF